MNPKPNFIIRLLTPNDFLHWKAIRLKMLQADPESFGSSYEEEIKFSDVEWQSGLNKNYIIGY